MPRTFRRVCVCCDRPGEADTGQGDSGSPSATPSLQAFCSRTEAVFGILARAGGPIDCRIAYETRHARMENFAVT